MMNEPTRLNRSTQSSQHIFRHHPDLLVAFESFSLSEAASSFDWFLAHQLLSYELKAQPDLAFNEQLYLCLLVLALRHGIARGQGCIEVSDFTANVLNADLEEFKKRLATLSIVQTQTQESGSHKPIILDGEYLYFERYYSYQQSVFEQLQKRATQSRSLDKQTLKHSLESLFPTQDTNLCDWQKVAAAMACMKPLSIITGGPGTGKTTTVAKLLACLLQQQPKLNIALAAPTGKAAARMMESLRQARQNLPLLADMALPEKSYTLHRLLGYGFKGFKHHQSNPIEADLVIVDEASMIDLPMMSHLLSALKEDVGLILLGDEHQLSSVEVGSVLADISASNQELNQQKIHTTLAADLNMPELLEQTKTALNKPALTGVLASHITKLKTSYRFDANSAIGRLAQAINTGQTQQALDILQQKSDEITWAKEPWAAVKHTAESTAWFYQGLSRYMELMLQVQKGKAVEAGQILDALGDFQILVATRSGTEGLVQMNQWAQSLLQAHGVIDASQSYYVGQPIMISKNNADLSLFNGDVGVILPAVNEPNKLVACFRQTDGRIREIMPSRLPEHDTAFAITVHKSQGSEFKQVMLVLPDNWLPLLNRQLIYTALTRAKKQFSIVAPKECLTQSIRQQSLRASGLKEKLWSKNG